MLKTLESIAAPPTLPHQETRVRSWISIAFAALALIYAFFAGFKTIGDPDLGWQIATGRWILQHHAIPRIDVLSYNGGDGAWIYPVLSQIFFYCAYLVGGYSLLSWVCAAASVATTAVQMRGNLFSLAIAVIAVPLIALHSAPRAELFSTLLFATFVSVLWRYHRAGRGPLWILPILMFLWVNLHLGYIAGLGMCAAYLFLESEELLHKERRPAVLTRLRRAAPWLAAVLGATVLNPWGLQNYFGMARLVPVQSNSWILELASLSPTPRKILEGLTSIRDPRDSFWWLLAIAVLAIISALFQKRFSTAIVLAVAVYCPFHTIRFQGLFATIVVVIAGSVLADHSNIVSVRQIWNRVTHGLDILRPNRLATACFIALVGITTIRVSDLVTNRYYIRTPFSMGLFGSGASPWFPERAAAFMKEGNLPANIFNDYTIGGFVSWKLGPQYLDYIDGRGNAGAELFFRTLQLLQSPLDSSEWQEETEQKKINTVFTSLDYELGGGLVELRQFCDSNRFRLVYMDPTSSLFVRVTPETQPVLTKFGKDCKTIRFDTPPTGKTYRSKAERFLYLRNAAAILIVINRPNEALEMTSEALNIFPDNGEAHFLKGMALLSRSEREAAEKELELSVRIEPTDANSENLAGLYRQSKRFHEAFEILDKQISRSARPATLTILRGFVEIDLNSPAEALRSFDEAEKASPFVGGASILGTHSRSLIAQGRANAWWVIATDFERRGLSPQASKARQESARFQREADNADANP